MTSLIIYILVLGAISVTYYFVEIQFSRTRKNPDGIDYTEKIWKKRYNSFKFTVEEFYLTQDQYELKKDDDD